jgi:integrase
MITKHRTGHLYKKGSCYYLQFMVDGRRVKQALKNDKGEAITTKEDAEAARTRIMAPLMVAEREQALRTVTHRLDDSIEAREALENGTPGLRLVDAWEAYVASVNRPDSGPRTLKGYEAQWRQFVEWMREAHAPLSQLKHVSPRIAEEYAAYMLKDIREEHDGQPVIVKRAFTTNTFNKHVRVLELVFRVLAKKAGVEANPWAEITRKTENKASRRELTIEELNTICNRAEGELRALLVLGIYTGLRLGDCCTLRWSEVDLARRIILRVPNKTARRKGLPVHIPIHPTLLTFLEQTPKAQRSGFVVPDFAGKYRNNDAEVAKILRNHFKSCGIQVHAEGTGFKRAPSRGSRTKNVHTGKRAVVEVGFHSLRHSFVSLCRQSNAPLAVVEAIVGHSNPAMTRHYTHVGDVAAGQAVAALPAIGGEFVGSGQMVAGDRSPVIGDPPSHKASGFAKATPDKTEDRGQVTLSERDQKLVAILGKMTAETWENDREEMLTVLLGVDAQPVPRNGGSGASAVLG